MLALGAAAGLTGLVVLQVHAAGQSLLATALLAIASLALWTYGSRRTQAMRYLFPAVAAAMVFVVFPMVYTVGLSFTNMSSRNLLGEDEARAVLLRESAPVAGTRFAFTLHPRGDRWQILLRPESGPALLSPPLALGSGPRASGGLAQEVDLAVAGGDRGALPEPAELGPAAPVRAVVERIDALRELRLRTPTGQTLMFTGLREFQQLHPAFEATADGGLRDRASGTLYRPDRSIGFFLAEGGGRLQPGFQVGVGLQHYLAVFGESRFREPFVAVFAWTVIFAGLSVAGAAALGLLLAVLFQWEALRFKAAYRLVLFLPYAVPGFISILVFKGLFNQNLGEINLILNHFFGIRPAWFSDPTLARTMLLMVNIWLGFPYMMVLCSGLIQSIPGDLGEASAVLGAGPWTHFRRVTLPLILRPLTPLLISAFAFNFNNFVLISLLTGGRPDHLDSTLPAGTTDILVSYTWRIAFQDSGQQFGLAAAVSTIIFLMVAGLTVLQLRMARRGSAG